MIDQSPRARWGAYFDSGAGSGGGGAGDGEEAFAQMVDHSIMLPTLYVGSSQANPGDTWSTDPASFVVGAGVDNPAVAPDASNFGFSWGFGTSPVSNINVPAVLRWGNWATPNIDPFQLTPQDLGRVPNVAQMTENPFAFPTARGTEQGRGLSPAEFAARFAGIQTPVQTDVPFPPDDPRGRDNPFEGPEEAPPSPPAPGPVSPGGRTGPPGPLAGDPTMTTVAPTPIGGLADMLGASGHTIQDFVNLNPDLVRQPVDARDYVGTLYHTMARDPAQFQQLQARGLGPGDVAAEIQRGFTNIGLPASTPAADANLNFQLHYGRSPQEYARTVMSQYGLGDIPQAQDGQFTDFGPNAIPRDQGTQPFNGIQPISPNMIPPDPNSAAHGGFQVNDLNNMSQQLAAALLRR